MKNPGVNDGKKLLKKFKQKMRITKMLCGVRVEVTMKYIEHLLMQNCK
jgi:hypothetical protein